MEKKPSRSSSNSSKSSERLIDRILNRLKMIKRSSHTSVTDTQQSVDFPSSSNQQNEEYFNDYQYNWQYRKISPDDLEPFCDQLEKFLKYVRDFQELTYLTYDCPSNLQSRLDTQVNELQSLYLEVKDAVTTIDRLKKQKKSVRKEKSRVKKTLKKLKEEEIQEMETIISVYDKPMFTRWENIKSTNKPEVLEAFLHEVIGKQQALENLNTLASRRLGQLHTSVPLLTSTENAASAVLAAQPVSVSTAGTSTRTGTENSSTEDQNCTTVTKRHHHTSGSSAARAEARRRRRRNNDRHENHNSRPTTPLPLQQNSSNSDLTLLPFTMGPSIFQFAGTSIPTPINITTAMATNSGSNSNHELVTMASSTNTTNALRSTETTTNGSSTNIGSEFQSEMRTVLQALFGELSQESPITIDINDSDAETTDNENREIELYTIRRSPTQP